MNISVLFRPLLISVCLLSACSSLPVLETTHTLHEEQVFASPLESQLTGDLYKPEGEGPFPAVLVIHGGGWVGGKRADMERISRQLVRAGLVVFNIDYRSARQHAHPAQLEDCREAVRWLRQNAARFNIDENRIGALGYSAGGHLALMLGVTRPERETVSSQVHAVVAGGAPVNLLAYPGSGLVKKLMGDQRITGRGHLWADASPITHVSSDDAPTLLYHGLFDLVVRYDQAASMALALEQAGVMVESHPVPFGHALTHVLSVGSIDRAIKFLKSQPPRG